MHRPQPPARVSWSALHPGCPAPPSEDEAIPAERCDEQCAEKQEARASCIGIAPVSGGKGARQRESEERPEGVAGRAPASPLTRLATGTADEHGDADQCEPVD